jgi:hypothetical protein
VGKTKVGGIDLNRSRMRLTMRAIVALSTSPTGFSASEVAGKAQRLGGMSATAYTARQAAYDLKKLRGKQWVHGKGIHIAMNLLPTVCGP